MLTVGVCSKQRKTHTYYVTMYYYRESLVTTYTYSNFASQRRTDTGNESQNIRLTERGARLLSCNLVRVCMYVRATIFTRYFLRLLMKQEARYQISLTIRKNTDEFRQNNDLISENITLFTYNL